MPRKDRTFSDKDILRFLARNLTRPEQRAVLEALGALPETPSELEFNVTRREAQKRLSLTRKDLIALLQNAEEVLSILEDLKNPATVARKVVSLGRRALEETEATK